MAGGLQCFFLFEKKLKKNAKVVYDYDEELSVKFFLRTSGGLVVKK